MNKLLISMLILIILSACDQSPDFSKQCIIIEKYSINKSTAKYRLNNEAGSIGEGWGPVRFKAPPSFGNVGDTIVFKDNKLCIKNKIYEF